MQLHGAYLFDGILDDIKDLEDQQKLVFLDLVKSLAHFDVKWNLVEEKEYLPDYAVLINILQRGLPTRMGITACQIFADSYEEIESAHSAYQLNYQFTNKFKSQSDLYQHLFLALHVIDPRLNASNIEKSFVSSWESLGSTYEENFLFKVLPQAIGSDFIVQILESQRTITSIAKSFLESKRVADNVQNNFSEQRSDFSVEAPYLLDKEIAGMVIEIDGQQHQERSQQYLDTERDHAVAQSGWTNTLRITTADFNTATIKQKLGYLASYLEETTYFYNLRTAYEFNFLATPKKRNFLELCISPIAIARLQRVLLEYISAGKLSLLNKKWKIAIIERDVPCAYIAITDLKVQIESLFRLQKKELELPEIELSVYNTAEFSSSPINKLQNSNKIEDWDSEARFDLVVDISVLQRAGINSNLKTANANLAVIRSSFHQYQERIVKSSAFINYPLIATKVEGEEWLFDEESKTVLEQFLQSIFRKNNFRIGQIPIISKALHGESVIGLLPTGGGKSLTYQISAFLQPGITLAVDPIKSLMKDQVHGLLKNYIDSCAYINSTLKGADKQKALYAIKKGKAQFAFISPERLQMQEFRAILNEMFEEGNYFSYCVIDEAHCVSEWGHDFRTAYLRLGENAINFCKTKSGHPITLFGLTATASFDVLSDIQRELSGNSEERTIEDDAIIRMENSKRPELQFEVVPISFDTDNIYNNWTLRERLGQIKHAAVLEIIKNAPKGIAHFLKYPENCFEADDDFQLKKENTLIKNYNPSVFYQSPKNAGLVFCPHTKGHFGVTDRFSINKRTGQPVGRRNGYADIISSAHPELKVGFFMGASSDNENLEEIEDSSIKNQDAFIDSKQNILVATKAFGMGIDKENIRYTVHVNYPGSIESYMQEAGRAGRDGKIAISYLLFNDQIVEVDGKEFEIDLDHNLYFHKNSFKGLSKELSILNELLYEVYFPNRTFEIEHEIFQKLDVEVKIGFWQKDTFKGLFISKSFTEKLGYFNLSNSRGVPKDSVDPALSHEIFKVIKDYITTKNPQQAIENWIQTAETGAGILNIMDKLNLGESFNLTIGFSNNNAERIEKISKSLKQILNNDSYTPAFVREKREKTQGFLEFVEALEQLNSGSLDLETQFQNRDTKNQLEKGKSYKIFEHYYNGYRDKMDTEKAIYRLITIGIIDDYTIDFAANTFTISGIKKSDLQYVENLRNFLLKYYSEKLTEIKLQSLRYQEGNYMIEKCLSFLISFVYEEIESKRQRAISDMKDACYIGIKEKNLAFKEYVDLYFNSKYARKGYSYFDESQMLVVNASLTDLTDEGRATEEIDLIWEFINIVELDQGSYIDNVKHLRGATTRLLRSQPENYIFLLLNAFSIYQVAFKHERFLLDAEKLVFDGFFQILEKTDLSEAELEAIFNQFVKIIIEKNPKLPQWMKKYNLVFDFDQILLSRLIKPLQQASGLLKNLNTLLIN
jgi:ATP-dependent DNA helicase RecQ